MPFVKSIKIKPAVYEFRSEHFPSSYSVPKDVLRWGWFDVKELAEIAESSERHLLYRFIDFRPRKFFCPYYSNIRVYEPPSLIMITSAGDFSSLPPKLEENSYELHWYNRNGLFNHNCYLRNGKGHNRHIETIDKFLFGRIFVPAGWGLAVLKEIEKQNSKRISCTDKSGSLPDPPMPIPNGFRPERHTSGVDRF